MIQRKTLRDGIKDEKMGIIFYSTLSRLADTEEDRRLYKHIADQEREHLRILEHKLKNYVERKGQTNIDKLINLE